MPRLRRFLPLLVLAVAIGAIWASGIAGELSWAALARHQAGLLAWVDRCGPIAAVAYVLLYAAAVALSLPQAVVLTITGGLLFGTILGGALAVLGATIGAVALFLIARSALGDSLAAKGGPFLQKLRDELHRDGFTYLLAIRLIPAFPFWLVNLAAALGGMRLLPYAAATLIGIAPGTFVFASIGAGVGEILATGGTPNLAVIFSWPILGPLVALAVLSLLPILWRRWRKDVA